MNWREALICLVLLGASILLWQALKEEDEPVVDIEVNNQELPGFYINGADLVRYQEDGKPIYTIKAESIEQDPKTNQLNLSQLSIVYGIETPWQINADNATLPNDRKTIQFSGNVEAKPVDNQQNISFRSNSLNYDVEAQRLTTNDRVTAKSGLRRMNATGMTLDMTKERVQLHSKVKIRINNP